MLRLILFLLFYLQSNIGFTTPFVSSYLVNGEADRWYATRPIGDIFAYGQATLTTAEGYASDESNLLRTSTPFEICYGLSNEAGICEHRGILLELMEADGSTVRDIFYSGQGGVRIGWLSIPSGLPYEFSCAPFYGLSCDLPSIIIQIPATAEFQDISSFFFEANTQHGQLFVQSIEHFRTGIASATNTAEAPEPKTYATLLVGLCLMGFTLRRRKTSEHS